MAKKEWLTKGADDLSFGERLEDLMEKKGITQAELSKETGIHQSAISGYVSGQRSDPEDDTTRKYRAPDCATVITLAEFFSVSTDYLLGLTRTPSPAMKVRAVCDYTGLSAYSAELLHAFKSPKRGIITRLIDGIVSNIDEDAFDWIRQSAQAEAIAALGADFAEEKTDIMNRVGYLSRDRGGQYVLPASAAADYFLHKTIDTLTSQVAEVVEEMRNDMLSDIGEMQCDDARYFRFVKVDDEELTEGNDGND